MTSQELKDKIDSVLGNSIRCLLPSYWWKKIFHLVVDKIDDARVPIVNTKEELNKLDVSEGQLASVISEEVWMWKSFRECYQPTGDEEHDFPKLTRIKKIKVTTATVSESLSSFYMVDVDDNTTFNMAVATSTAGFVVGCIVEDSQTSQEILFIQNDVEYQSNINAFNDLLASKNVVYVGPINSTLTEEQWTQIDAIFSWGEESTSGAGVFVKDKDAWIKLLSEKDRSIAIREFKTSNSAEDKAWNVETINLFKEGRVSICCRQVHNNNYYSILNLVRYLTPTEVTKAHGFGFQSLGTSSNTDYTPIWLWITEDGTLGDVESETYELATKKDIEGIPTMMPVYYCVNLDTGTVNDFNEEELNANKDAVSAYWNKGISYFYLVMRVTQNSVIREQEIPILIVSGYSSGSDKGIFFNTKDWDNISEGSSRWIEYKLKSDGTYESSTTVASPTIKTLYIPDDDYTSTTISDNKSISFDQGEIPIINKKSNSSASYLTGIIPVYAQNRTVRYFEKGVLYEFSYDNSGNYTTTKLGQVSTEDFTTALKAKLESLNNYDDTEITQAIETLTRRFEALLGQNASEAIENFNEIMAFLDGIKDSESLDSIIASIEQQIASARDAIPTKTSELTNDSGFLTEHQDVSHLATKEDLKSKQDVISDLETIRSGAALGATALQKHQDISHLATKEELEETEEVTAYAFADITEKYSSLNERVRLGYATKAEVNAIKDMFLNEIVDNEEVVAKALSLLESRLSIIENL